MTRAGKTLVSGSGLPRPLGNLQDVVAPLNWSLQCYVQRTVTKAPAGDQAPESSQFSAARSALQSLPSH